jgi:hypothetical protein
MLFVRPGVAMATLASLLILASCSPGTAPAGSGDAKLIVTANVSGTAVATVVVEVAASDLPTPMVFNIPVVAGVASGTITIPAGSNRTVTIRAFDTGGVLTHSGATTLNVQAGTNPTISLTLTPLSGDVPILATLGSFTVVVTPTPNTLSLGGSNQTVQLTVTLLDIHGQPTTGTVSWATHDPGIAAVSATGLVSVVGVGQTNIFATSQGAVGSAAITVGP